MYYLWLSRYKTLALWAGLETLFIGLAVRSYYKPVPGMIKPQPAFARARHQLAHA
ncbi:hypothetical protein CC1G_01865 [Coprinopsis cinerea okayama7|uniref:Uncharacterized protein n=1 Tax=Coprinopsis cinerea (strain Okayama-7 / 130 / ATCC MYA-4618 / FGSC 9003) TaxID=240176 RepID=A8N2Q1_COPC7|nr:hypothetical protein CC1G_01865 [Coprinopsis cinerea okayama7\|eukprot:XP_001829185.1 hypothetical protein CC1G_01865 [Coprinopsis cinerea okayama7\